MAIVRNPPNTIYLGGVMTEIGDMSAKEVIRPGHLVERINTAGVWRWQKHATAGGNTTPAVALNQSMLNKGVDDDYGVADLMQVGIFAPGGYAWMLIASGQNIAYGNKLESAGDGTLRILAAGTPLFVAVETQANVTAQTRIRVEAV